jgi:hypothetical protein
MTTMTPAQQAAHEELVRVNDRIAELTRAGLPTELDAGARFIQVLRDLVAAWERLLQIHLDRDPNSNPWPAIRLARAHNQPALNAWALLAEFLEDTAMMAAVREAKEDMEEDETA